jgi:hypothetical protein
LSFSFLLLPSLSFKFLLLLDNDSLIIKDEGSDVMNIADGLERLGLELAKTGGLGLAKTGGLGLELAKTGGLGLGLAKTGGLGLAKTGGLGLELAKAVGEERLEDEAEGGR